MFVYYAIPLLATIRRAVNILGAIGRACGRVSVGANKSFINLFAVISWVMIASEMVVS